MTAVELGFSGEVADFYHKYRDGYPSAVIDALVDAFGLNDRDVVVDLGCGTGQLTLPMARRVRAMVGMDPEPDMLRCAQQAARDVKLPNVSWMIGAGRRRLPDLAGPCRPEADRILHDGGRVVPRRRGPHCRCSGRPRRIH